MSLGETGARRAPASSCAFWLTLPPRALILRRVSLMLFCLPWPRVGGPGSEAPHCTPRAELSLRGRQESAFKPEGPFVPFTPCVPFA